MGAVLTPDVGSPILPTDPVVFDLTDATETLTSILIAVRHDSGLIELVHDGTSFTSFYASGSTRTVITDGYRYSLIRAGGWADTKVVVSAFPFAGTGAGLINFSSDFGVLSDPPGEDVALSVTGVSAGTYGNSSHVGQFTTDSKGRLTAAASVTIILANNSGTTITNVGTGGTTATNAAIISDVDSRVATEAAARAAADATEATARAAGDTTLTTNLNTEITNRIAGDTNAISVSETFATNAIAAARTTLEADGIVTGSVQLASLAFPAAGAVSCRVASVRDEFVLDRTSTLTADGITVVTALGGTGRWIRLQIADPSWATQTAWKIDPSGGNDENLGDSTHALKTKSEFARRTDGVKLAATWAVTITGSLNAGDDGVPRIIGDVGTGFHVSYVGVPISAFSGTIDTLVNRNGATRVATQATCNTIPTSWTASGLVGKIIESASGAMAVVVKDLGSKTAQLSPPVDKITGRETTFVSGESFNVWTLPNIRNHVVFGGWNWFTYLDATRWVLNTGAIIKTNCSGPTTFWAAVLAEINCVGGLAVSGQLLGTTGQIGVQGGYNFFNASGPAFINVKVACAINSLTVEGNGTFSTSGVSGTPADIEIVSTGLVPDAVINMDALQGGRCLFGGNFYGTSVSANIVAFSGQDSLVQFAKMPVVTGASTIRFVLAGTTGNISDIATKQVDDAFLNRVVGPAGPTLNDNHSRPIANLGSGGTTRSNGANIGDVQDALTAYAFGTTSATTLQAIDTSALTEGAIRRVFTYRANFQLVDGTVKTLATIPHVVYPAAGRTNWWWVRLDGGDQFWRNQTVWYIDPAGTNSTPGNDEADGLTSSTPIKSTAEWRRRINGAVYSGNGPVIHALSGSTNADDGVFYGFSVIGQIAAVRLLGAPVLTGVSGTVGSYVPYAGNTRGQFTDASIPTSWTISGAISSPTGSRWVRKVGSGVRHYAQLIKDLGSKTVQFGHVVDWDETDPVAVRTAETNFANGDAYEVVSLLSWPPPVAASGTLVVQCLDFQGYASPAFLGESSLGGFLSFRLCGFPDNSNFTEGTRQTLYSCVLCALSPKGFSFSSNGLYLTNCSAVNTIVEFSLGGFALSTTSLILVNSEFRLFHAAFGGTLGNMRFFDCSTPLISLRHDSTAKCTAAVVGSGNTGPLVNCDSFGVLAGASLITATTSKANPYTVNGVDYATPVVDGGSGDGIYN